MVTLSGNKASAFIVLAILILAFSFQAIPSTARAAAQNNDWTAKPLFIANPAAANGPSGLAPTQIITAYNLTSTTNGTGTTIAIIDAYDDPTITTDLDSFSTQFNLPTINSTNFTFIKHKMAPNISTDSNWATEISLDVEWAHAIAPNATILLVEAQSARFDDLVAAVNYATTYNQIGVPPVKAVSMSWGGNEFSDQTDYDSTFTSNTGIVFFASSGDTGRGSMWPSSSSNVVSVGGTSLHVTSTGALISETAWSESDMYSRGWTGAGSGGGISAYEPQPTYQKNYGLNYTTRTTPDVSYDANPYTGFSVYDSTPYQGNTGWFLIGGTSAGAPQWAAIQALGLTANNANFYQDAKSAYSSYLRDVTVGSTGYSASKGYDLVTGLGSPLTTNFTPSTTPDFSISTTSPDPIILSAGTSKTSTITLKALNGFNGAASLTTTASGGITATLNATSITPSDTPTLTIQFPTTSTNGMYSVTVTGVSETESHSITITVQGTGHPPLNTPSNTQVWSYGTGGGVGSSPAISNGVVYIGSFDRDVYALNATTGAYIWSYITGAAVFSSPTLSGGVVYVGSDDGNVYALNATTGTQLWNYTTDWNPGFGNEVESSPCVAGGVVYVGSYDGKIFALNATSGLQLWSYTTAINYHYGVWVESAPRVASGIVYVGCGDGNLYALNAQNGALIWNYTTGSWIESAPAIFGGAVYVSSDDGKVYAFNAANGTQLWNCTINSNPTWGNWIASSPAVADGVVYVGSDNGDIYALNATSGSTIWNFTTGSSVESSPCVVDGIVYVGSDDGNLYVLNATNGALLKSFTTHYSYLTGNAIQSSPAVANGMVYVGSYNGQVYALSFWMAAPTLTPSASSVDQGQTSIISSSAMATGVSPYTYQWFEQAPGGNYAAVGSNSSSFSFVTSSNTVTGSWSFILQVTDNTGTAVNSTAASVSVNAVPIVITVTQGANGVIAPETTSVNYGGSQAFTITPSAGYFIASLTVDGSPAAVASSYTFSNIQASHTITATFELTPNPTPTPTSTPTATPTPTPSPTLTPTPTPTQTPTPTPTQNPTPTPTPTSTLSPTPTPTPTPTTAPTPTPTPTSAPTPLPSQTSTPNPALLPTIAPTSTPNPTTSPTATPTPTASTAQTPTPPPTSTVTTTTDTGSTVNITISGNVTSSQMSEVTIASNQSASTTTLSFTLTGTSGTTGFSNVTIPINAIPYGTIPTIYIDGQIASNQGYTQDAINYYVWYTTHLSTHQITIMFTATTSPTPEFPSATIGVVAIMAATTAGLFYIRKLKKKTQLKPWSHEKKGPQYQELNLQRPMLAWRK